MLPFTKRATRFEEDPIHTGDFEVVAAPSKQGHARSPSAYPPAPAAPSARPRAFARSIDDEEMTTLLPRKGMTFSARPQHPSVTPVPLPKAASSRPRPALEEPPTRQFIVPSTPPPPSVSPVAGPPRASSRPAALAASTAAAAPAAAPAAPQHARIAMRPQHGPGDSSKSDPKIDPPATVITARTRIIAARPTMSWAAALLAMGVFVGLVTAVVARGDADTLIDAAATFVDPSGEHGAAAGASVQAVQTKAEITPKTLASSVDDLVAPADPSAPEAKAAAADPIPMPARRPAPVAYASPARRASRPAFHASAPKAAPAAAAPDDRVAAAAPAATKPAKAAPAAKHADDDDMSGASAADALAKAQLEASLQ